MPSPTSRTLPTSARSTSLLYWRISSSMTEAISSTLNFIAFPKESAEASDRTSELNLGDDVLRAALDLLRGAPQERRREVLQAGLDARIDPLVAHPHHHAAQEVWVDALDEL